MTASIAEAARHYAARDLARAAQACLDILRDEPRHFDALHLLGVICANRGQLADGVSYLLRADASRPGDPRVQANLGAAYGAVQRFDKAVACYRVAVAGGHRDAGVLNNLALALQGLGERDEALATFHAALALDPANDPALYNLARCQIAAGEFAAAEANLRRLHARLSPTTPADRVREATNEFARVLTDLGRPEEALAVLRAAAARAPDVVSFRWHEALLLLLLGRYQEGWRAYETRWDAPGHDHAPAGHRVLDLDQVAGQRVLVREEQGRGDVIQFLRYVPLLAARGARVVLSVYPDLLPLAREIAAVERVLEPDDDVVQCDLVTALMSLPLAFATDLGSIPAAVPYLRAPADRVARIGGYLGESSGQRIGLVWSGSTASLARSAIPCGLLAPLLQRGGVEFHCLQKDIAAADREWVGQTGMIRLHDAMLRDFGDTAALIEAMDLVISIDTAVAHLAGALAKPVWIMLPFNPDWRWLLHRDDSPWYPTARLFRQPKPGDWDDVVGAIANALSY